MMTIEKVDKWLDDEYGISYTELRKIDEFICEERNKFAEKERELQRRIDKAIEYIEKTQEGYVSELKLLDILRGEDK